MELFLIIIIIILAYFLFKSKKKNGEDFVETANKYGKAFGQAASVFKSNIQEKQEDSFSSDNLFIDGLLNPSYVIDPSKQDDEEFFKFIESYNESENKSKGVKDLYAWGPFNHDGLFDEDTQTNIIPYKKYWIFFKSTKNEIEKLLKFIKVTSDETNAKILAAKEILIYVTVHKLKKNPVRWVGSVSLSYDNFQVNTGFVAGNTQHQLWEKVKLFKDSKLELYNNQIEAYEDFSD